MVAMEVLQTPFICLWEGMNEFTAGDMVCLLSLGHYGTYILGFGALSQKVTNYSIK